MQGELPVGLECADVSAPTNSINSFCTILKSCVATAGCAANGRYFSTSVSDRQSIAQFVWLRRDALPKQSWHSRPVSRERRRRAKDR